MVDAVVLEMNKPRSLQNWYVITSTFAHKKRNHGIFEAHTSNFKRVQDDSLVLVTVITVNFVFAKLILVRISTSILAMQFERTQRI